MWLYLRGLYLRLLIYLLVNYFVNLFILLLPEQAGVCLHLLGLCLYLLYCCLFIFFFAFGYRLAPPGYGFVISVRDFTLLNLTRFVRSPRSSFIWLPMTLRTTRVVHQPCLANARARVHAQAARTCPKIQCYRSQPR